MDSNSNDEISISKGIKYQEKLLITGSDISTYSLYQQVFFIRVVKLDTIWYRVLL